MNKLTTTIIILLIIFQIGVPAQAHEVFSCGITEVIKTEQTTIPENYIAGDPIYLSYSFTSLNNTPVQISTNITQTEIGNEGVFYTSEQNPTGVGFGEWAVLITIDGNSLNVLEDQSGKFISEEVFMSDGTHNIFIIISSLPYILPADYIVLSVLASNPCVPVEHSHESGSTSSGSGGVGVVSDECFATIIRKETRDNDLRFGSYVPFYFTSDIPVYEVHVKGLKSDPDVAVRVELLNDISCRLTENPPGRIYKFVNIFSGIKQDGVKIAFKVESEWLTTGATTLMRWQDGAWKDLNAIQTKADDKYTYFEANSGGFSHFAIVEAVATPAPTLITTPAPTPAKPDVSVVGVTASQEPESTPLYGIILVILLILIAVLFLMWYFLIRNGNQ